MKPFPICFSKLAYFKWVLRPTRKSSWPRTSRFCHVCPCQSAPFSAADGRFPDLVVGGEGPSHQESENEQFQDFFLNPYTKNTDTTSNITSLPIFETYQNYFYFKELILIFHIW